MQQVLYSAAIQERVFQFIKFQNEICQKNTPIERRQYRPEFRIPKSTFFYRSRPKALVFFQVPIVKPWLSWLVLGWTFLPLISGQREVVGFLSRLRACRLQPSAYICQHVLVQLIIVRPLKKKLIIVRYNIKLVSRLRTIQIQVL